MRKKWIYKSIPAVETVNDLSKSININSHLATILLQRGIDTFDKAKTFFRPTLAQLHDPFLMKDMAAAVTRLKSAIDNQEKILIYGDYDVDGTTAVA